MRDHPMLTTLKKDIKRFHFCKLSEFADRVSGKRKRKAVTLQQRSRIGVCELQSDEPKGELKEEETADTKEISIISPISGNLYEVNKGLEEDFHSYVSRPLSTIHLCIIKPRPDLFTALRRFIMGEDIRDDDWALIQKFTLVTSESKLKKYPKVSEDEE
ncbi:hypothetical protein ADUPG1_009260 [Aduncisulcus paluster]|uniref:Uncharacterized protein n=1 Tax=Aduncisulcus paluster TaxID=2918883 RepID=A0ABQ5KW79_9EUKA|nr:hypothetical protein ADUPG1_009260 [Aduncisulcus paluster]